MASRRYYANNAPTQTLSAQISNSATSLTVTSFAGWPTQYPFFATLELGTASEEIISVTNVVGSTATIARGQDGSAAISHLAGASLDFTVVRQDFDEANQHTSSNSGVHGVSGNVVGTSDVQTLTNKTLTSPVLTGTLAGASQTLSGTLGVTGATTTGSLAVTNNATVGGTLGVTGAATVASLAATGAVSGSSLSGVVAPTSYTNQAAAGAATAGLVVYLTAPTGSAVRPGLFVGNGTTWDPIAGYKSATVANATLTTSGTNAAWTAFTNWATSAVVNDPAANVNASVSASGIQVLTAGTYLVSCALGFASSANGRRGVSIYINGTMNANLQTLVPAAASILSDTRPGPTAIIDLNANDVVTIGGYQDSGAALSIGGNATSLSVTRLF